MYRNVRWLPAALAATLLVGQTVPAGAVCQIPLAIGQNTGNANVMIMLDNSGSMNEALMSSAYNPRTSYSGRFSRTTDYEVYSSGSYTPQNFGGTWPTTPSAYLVSSDCGNPAVYRGNYLNWLFFHATAAQRAAIPTVTRLQSAKQTIADFLGTISDVRLGLEVFNYDDGGTLVQPIGASVGSIQSSVMSTCGNSWTPLGETLLDCMNYYKQTGGSAPITGGCQQSFVVIVTDGLPTRDSSFPSYIRDADRDGFYLDDVAKYGYRNDLRGDLPGIQNVATFTVGFNLDADLLRKTANVGGGAYFSIDDADGLTAALTATFNAIAARVAAGAAVSVVASEDRQNNRLFRARYESQTWRGYLEAFDLPYHAGDSPLWDAGALLAARSASSRTIMTSIAGTTLLPFTTTYATALQPFIGLPTVAEAQDVITYVRGDSLPGTRSREGWKLGDIVDPAPVMVGKPVGFSELSGHTAFRVANQGRREVLYVAANDGMLHCFDVDDGSELWSYIPRSLLPRLQNLMDPLYCHEYFLNMTPGVYDIKFGSQWKTILVGGAAQGGNALFALDVTTPAADSVELLWDVNPAQLKGAYAPPALVMDRQLGRHVLCIGTGYDPATAQANLLVIDPLDGSILRTFAVGSPAAGNKITKIVTFDSDFDGYEDRMYFGDLTGKLWRVNLTTSPWTLTAIYSGSQPIQAPPILTVDELDRPMLFFGTGRFIAANDPSTTTQESIFGIIDNGTNTTLTKSDLVNQTSTFSNLPANSRGWYYNLEELGERVTKSAALISGTLYVPSFKPAVAACTGGGQSWLKSLDFRDGSAPDNPNGTENNTTDDRSQSMGDGILTDPTVDLVNEQLILQSSNAVLLTEDLSANLKKLLVRSWRQKLN